MMDYGCGFHVLTVAAFCLVQPAPAAALGFVGAFVSYHGVDHAPCLHFNCTAIMNAGVLSRCWHDRCYVHVTRFIWCLLLIVNAVYCISPDHMHPCSGCSLLAWLFCRLVYVNNGVFCARSCAGSVATVLPAVAPSNEVLWCTSKQRV